MCFLLMRDSTVTNRFNALYFLTVFCTILLYGPGSFVGLTSFCSRSPQRTYSLSSCGSSHTRYLYVVLVARPLDLHSERSITFVMCADVIASVFVYVTYFVARAPAWFI